MKGAALSDADIERLIKVNRREFGIRPEDAMKLFARAVIAADRRLTAEQWVVVRESVLDVGHGDDVRTGGRPELGYALLANATTFGSKEEASAASKAAGQPLGWVRMPLSRLLPDITPRLTAEQGGTPESIEKLREYHAMDLSVQGADTAIYWRAHDEAVAGVARRWEEALSGPIPKPGAMQEPLESLYRRTEALRAALTTQPQAIIDPAVITPRECSITEGPRDRDRQALPQAAEPVAHCDVGMWLSGKYDAQDCFSPLAFEGSTPLVPATPPTEPT